MPLRMFSVEGMMGLRSWRYADGTAILRVVVAANSSIADGVASALKPRRTRVSPYPTAAIVRANKISETAFQGFMSTSSVPRRTTYQDSEFCSRSERLAGGVVGVGVIRRIWHVISPLSYLAFIFRYLVEAKTGEPSHLHSPVAMRTQGQSSPRSSYAADAAIPDRNDLKPARSSSEKSFGCSQAAKCPPLGSLLK